MTSKTSGTITWTPLNALGQPVGVFTMPAQTFNVMTVGGGGGGSGFVNLTPVPKRKPRLKRVIKALKAASPRKCWYCEEIWNYNKVRDVTKPAVLEDPKKAGEWNVISSLCDDGMHRPAIDIDIPCHYVKSSTPGHGHLYFPDTALTWEQYIRLLEALVEAGIVEDKYLAHSIRNGQTLLRPPHVRK